MEMLVLQKWQESGKRSEIECGSAGCALSADGKGLFPLCVRAGCLWPKEGGRICCQLVYLLLGGEFSIVGSAVDERLDKGREVVTGWEEVWGRVWWPSRQLHCQ